MHVEVICGMVYLCIADTPPDIARFKAAVTPYIAPHHPELLATLIEFALPDDPRANRDCQLLMQEKTALWAA